PTSGGRSFFGEKRSDGGPAAIFNLRRTGGASFGKDRRYRWKTDSNQFNSDNGCWRDASWFRLSTWEQRSSRSLAASSNRSQQSRQPWITWSVGHRQTKTERERGTGSIRNGLADHRMEE